MKISKKTKILLLLIIFILIFIVFISFKKSFYFLKQENDKEAIKDDKIENNEIDLTNNLESSEELFNKESDNEVDVQQEEFLENEISEQFEKIIINLDNSQKIIDFFNQNFVFETKKENNALKPEEFFETKKGGEIDFMTSIAYILDYHHYETGIIRYEFNSNNETLINTVVVFRDKDLPKYIFLNQGKLFITHHGWSFEELFQKEDERLNIQITEFAIFYPNVFDLTIKEWKER